MPNIIDLKKYNKKQILEFKCINNKITSFIQKLE